MCWACEHPQATLQDYLGNLRAIITRRGWAVQAIGRDRLYPPWAYTTGLTLRGLPELVVTGMPGARAASLLNEIAAHAVHAGMPEPGTRVELVGGPRIEFVRVDLPAVHLVMAAELYGSTIRALQVVHADDRGHWPWEPAYRGVQGGQPILGRRTSAARTARAVTTPNETPVKEGGIDDV